MIKYSGLFQLCISATDAWFRNSVTSNPFGVDELFSVFPTNQKTSGKTLISSDYANIMNS
jgi:hypothetical protein